MRVPSPTRTGGFFLSILAAAVLAGSPAQAATPQAPGTFTGKAFDICAAPPQATMDAWKASSPFGAIGIYISGNSRYCGDGYNPNLTPTWVQTNADRGWRFLPIHVGYQSPCFHNNPDSRVQKKLMSSDPAVARAQAKSDAGEAVAALQKFGFGPGSASYLDLEAYARTTACDNAVLEFIDAWTETLHASGYISGVYSSGASAIKVMSDAMVANRAGFNAPDHAWNAWTNGMANTDGGTYLSPSLFTNHQRIHQYDNSETETFGGKTLTIDWDYVDIAATSVPMGKRALIRQITAGTTPTLRRGSTGEAVVRVQTALQVTGRNVKVTGIYNRRTIRAVRSYRKANHLTVGNRVGPAVWRALQAGKAR